MRARLGWWRHGRLWAIWGVLLLVALMVGSVTLPAAPAAADPTVGPTISVGTGLGAIAVDESAHRIYVVDEKTNTLFAIDGATNRVAGSVAIPARSAMPHGVAADPATHRVFVTTDGGVLLVDGPSLNVLKTLASGVSFYPSVGVNPSTGRVFALRPPVPGAAATPVTLYGLDANGSQATVRLGNPASNLGSYTPSLTVDSKTGTVFVIGLDDGSKGSQMDVVDGATMGGATAAPRPEFAGITVNPATGRLYLVDSGAATLDVVDEANLTATLTRVALTASPNLGPVAVDPRTALVYVTGSGISVVDAATNRLLTVLKVQGPVALDTATSRGYAATPGGTTVTVLLEDTVAPDTTITSAPTTVPANSAATIQFTGSDNVTAPSALSFACAVDGGALAPCSSPVTLTLGRGQHTFTVRATDQAGNVDPSPATVTFTVAAPPTGASNLPPPATVTTIASATSPTSIVTDTTLPAAEIAAPPDNGSNGAGPAASSLPAAGRITVESANGRAAGPPGVALTVVGHGFPASRCHPVVLKFGADRIGTAEPDARGSFRATNLSVPGSAHGGNHAVTASCGPAVPVAHAAFVVTPVSLHRTSFVTSLHLPSQVPHTARDLGISALVAALLVLLVAFPSELFDNTLSENYEEVQGWFSFVRPLLDRLANINRAVVSVAAVLVLAVLYGLLDPGFGFGLSSLAQVLGLLLALAVMTAAYAGPFMVTLRRRYRESGRLAVLPAGMAVAAACVLVSRLFHFQPGYLYGAVIGLGFSRELDSRDESVLSALSVLSMLVVSAVAWLGWMVLERHAAGANPGFIVLALETALAAVTVSGIESTVIALLPLRFMDGARVMAWDRRVWAALFAVSCFAFVEILLRPGTGYAGHSEKASQVLVVATLLAFGLGSVAFWAYFRFRRPRAVVATGAGVGAGAGAVLPDHQHLVP